MNRDELFNDEVEQWTQGFLLDVKDELDALGVNHFKRSPNKTPLRKALKPRYYKRFGAINRIGIVMPRSAVFLHKGVSKGHPISDPRTAKEWFNPVVKRNIPELKDIVAKYHLDFVTNHILIK